MLKHSSTEFSFCSFNAKTGVTDDCHPKNRPSLYNEKILIIYFKKKFNGKAENARNDDQC